MSACPALEVAAKAGYLPRDLLRKVDADGPVGPVTAAGLSGANQSRVVRVRVRSNGSRTARHSFLHVFTEDAFSDAPEVQTAEYADQTEAHAAHFAWLDAR